MATWTDIPDSSLEPGKPIRSIDGLALRDNPIAIAEGDPNAPRVEVAAHRSPAAGDTYVLRRLVGSQRIETTETAYLPANVFVTSDPARHICVHIVVPGVIRCRVTQHARDITGTSFLRILKNGSTVIEWNLGGGSGGSWVSANRVVDVSVVPGDAITFQQRVLSGASGWSDISIRSSDLSLAVV